MQKSLIALFLLTSAAAFANEASDEQSNRAAAAAGERTRAEVTAQVVQARDAGILSVDDYAANLPRAAQGSGRSRSEVRGEAAQAARVRVVHEQI